VVVWAWDEFQVWLDGTDGSFLRDGLDEALQLELTLQVLGRDIHGRLGASALVVDLLKLEEIDPSWSYTIRQSMHQVDYEFSIGGAQLQLENLVSSTQEPESFAKPIARLALCVVALAAGTDHHAASAGLGLVHPSGAGRNVNTPLPLTAKTPAHSSSIARSNPLAWNMIDSKKETKLTHF